MVPEVEIAHVTGRLWVSGQRIQNQRSGLRENGFLVPEREQRADAPSLTPLASDLDRELDERLKNVGIVFRYLAENTFKHPSLSLR